MRLHPSRAGLLMPNRRLWVPQSARRQRGFLGMAPGFLSGPPSGGGSVGSNVKAWRLGITANNGSSLYVTAAELQMSFEGGSNLCTGGTPVATTQVNSLNAPSFAFDGDNSTQWTSNAAPSPSSIEAVGYIMATASNVDSISLMGFSTNPGAVSTTAPKDFTIQSSADTTNGINGIWINEWPVSGQTGWTAGESRIFTRTAHTGSTPWSARLKITANNGDTHAVEIVELQFRATVGGASLCTGGVANSNFSATQQLHIGLAFDGSSSTASDSDEAPTVAVPKIYAYVFPAASAIAEVAIIGCLAGDAALAPKDFVIQVSSNSTTGLDGDWSDWLTVTGQTGWAAGEMRTFTQP